MNPKFILDYSIMGAQNNYNPTAEKLNIITHAIGLVFSIIGTAIIMGFASSMGNLIQILSTGIFGFSLILLYSASTIYHSSKDPGIRKKLKIFDHISIYILIAGTYTPFSLLVLGGVTGWLIFGISWGLAVSGAVFKLFFTGRFEHLSTILYVLMGWIIVFALNPLIENMSISGLLWLITGGISYTLGAIVYSMKYLRFSHPVFHLFVLVGSFCHYYTLFHYVLPN